MAKLTSPLAFSCYHLESQRGSESTQRPDLKELVSSTYDSTENTASVWEWAPPGTPVRGCLVLAYESRIRRKSYDCGKQPVVVHTLASLERELKAEAREERAIDERVAAGVWEIGRVAE